GLLPRRRVSKVASDVAFENSMPWSGRCALALGSQEEWIMRRAIYGIGLVGNLAIVAIASAAATGFAGRPDAPAMPQSGEYKREEPKDWTPPTLEELQKWDWKPGVVTTQRALATERYAGIKPLVTEAEALSMKNDSREANEKILSVLGRTPKNDDEVD